MGSDGFAKGAVARDLPRLVMSGRLVLKHTYEQWYCKAPLELSGEAGDAFVAFFAARAYICALCTPRAGRRHHGFLSASS
eukprot:4740959-Lingulodinium_polyedra.AAC.1